MALPTAYLTTVKNLEGILNAIRGAQAPDKFTQKFLEGIGFKGNSDRLIINVLKALAFLDDGGRPTQRYFAYLDQAQSARVLAEGIREAYADLFKVNRSAQSMTKTDIVNKLKTLGEGKLSDSVAQKMAMTFLALAKHSDFKAVAHIPSTAEARQTKTQTSEESVPGAVANEPEVPPLTFDGLVYNIQIVLPESRDPAVYDAIFASLRTHLR
jgi:hypothetical protein